jgi:hypothetical protein
LKKRSIEIFLILVFFPIRFSAQPLYSLKEIESLDSIAKSFSGGSCFATLYMETMQQIELQIHKMPPEEIQQIRKLEISFANLFLEECHRFKDSNRVNETWRPYFTGRNLSSLQYRLFGINAHINGDLWQALVQSFSYDELKKNSNTVFLFHKSLINIYHQVYREAVSESKRVKTLHILTAGLDKTYGRFLLRKWRKRQLKIAMLKYTDSEKFQKKLKLVEKKKNKLDRMIERLL